MKLNKKILVPVLSTVMGLSLIGGVSGAVAWYQYNSRVTASFVGSSVVNTSVLQIGTMEGSDIEWGRDKVFGTTANDNKLLPVTFGAMEDDGSLPAHAYHTPEAGAADYDSGWEQATAGVEYVQFTVYLRAYASDASEESGYKQVKKDVYLSDIILEDATSGKDVSSALRIHIDVKDGSKFLISENKVTNLQLYGGLDLDKDSDGANDTVGGWAWENAQTRDEEIVYGHEGDLQNTLGISDIKQDRDADGYMPATANSKRILETPESGEAEVTITVWLEGWHKFGTGNAASAIWNPHQTAGTAQAPAAIHVGLKFDTGKNR